MADLGGLNGYLRRVRRRCVWNIVFEQTAVGVAAAMAGGILLLVAGTQIMEWYWLALLFGGSFLFGLVRTLRRSPAVYTLSQQVDARLDLHDCLSSAFYFSQHPDDSRGNPELRQALIEKAETCCREIPLVQAVPLRMPKAGYATAVLAMVALGMLGVRYGVLRSLDLSRPLSQTLIDIFRPTALFAAVKKPPAPKLPPELEQAGLTVDPATGEKNGDRSNALTPEGADPLDVSQMDQSPGQDPAAGEQSESAEGSEFQDGNSSDQESMESDPSAGKQSGGEKNPNQPGENSSLLDKMRDALANLMSKLKMQPKAGEGQQQASKKGGQQSGADQKQGKKGTPGEGQQQAQGSPNADAQGEQSQGGEQSQSAQGRTGEQGGDQQASEDSKSGIGKQDGSKDIREAAQLAAMGKISEILGKRQQNLTGEILVEVPSGNQQLKTAYTRRGASHSDTGGEIHRDEVPLVYQQYVQQYFEEIRKTAPPPKQP